MVHCKRKRLRANHKIFEEEAEPLNFKGIEFPINLKDIDKFERLNPEIEVNVFGYEAECVYPLRISKLIREKKFASFSRTNTVVLLRIFKTCFEAGFKTSWRD